MLTAVFEEAKGAGAPDLVIDIPGNDGNVQPIAEALQIRFTSTANAGGVLKGFATYYVIEFPEQWESFKGKQFKGHQIGVVRFRSG